MLKRKEHHTEANGFRWRGSSVTRIEEFSDSVFAITIALLLVSVEVPQSFQVLKRELKGFIGFAFSFAFLSYIWYSHYIFFRRYGSINAYMIFLNSCLLFLVMFYSYPLKFLTGVLFRFDTPMQHALQSNSEFASLMIIYSIGLAAVFLVFYLMYQHVLRDSSLDLNELEKLITKANMNVHLIMLFFGISSVLLVLTLPRNMLSFSGLVYFLIGPVQGFNGYHYGKKIKALKK